MFGRIVYKHRILTDNITIDLRGDRQNDENQWEGTQLVFHVFIVAIQILFQLLFYDLNDLVHLLPKFQEMIPGVIKIPN